LGVGTDIFGIHPNTQQGADLLAQECGYLIAMPDFFRGKGWKTDNIPAKEGRAVMQAYIQSIGSWEIVRADLLAVVKYSRERGKRRIGVRYFLFLELAVQGK
jgi:dienelactone hydrolase